MLVIKVIRLSLSISGWLFFPRTCLGVSFEFTRAADLYLGVFIIYFLVLLKTLDNL